MTITLEDDANVIIFAFEKLISFARENQYLFVVCCILWIAGVIWLDSGLTIHIDILESRKQVAWWAVSPTPRDIARSVPANSNDLYNQR